MTPALTTAALLWKATRTAAPPAAPPADAATNWPDVYAALDLRAAIRVAEAYVNDVPTNASTVARQASVDVRAQAAAASAAVDALEEALNAPRSWGGWLLSWVVTPRSLDVRYAAVMRCAAVLDRRMQRLLDVVRSPPCENNLSLTTSTQM